jgi:hypothetical protein
VFETFGDCAVPFAEVKNQGSAALLMRTRGYQVSRVHVLEEIATQRDIMRLRPLDALLIDEL